MTVDVNLVQELKKIYTLKALQENMKTPPPVLAFPFKRDQKEKENSQEHQVIDSPGKGLG